MEKIFTYGTLQDETIQQQIIGRMLGTGQTDTLRGYAVGKLVGIHAEYNIIYPRAGATVDGVVYEVTDDELKKIDEYEGDAYIRVSATLVSNTRVWVYRDNPSSKYHSHIITAEE